MHELIRSCHTLSSYKTSKVALCFCETAKWLQDWEYYRTTLGSQQKHHTKLVTHINNNNQYVNKTLTSRTMTLNVVSWDYSAKIRNLFLRPNCYCLLQSLALQCLLLLSVWIHVTSYSQYDRRRGIKTKRIQHAAVDFKWPITFLNLQREGNSGKPNGTHDPERKGIAQMIISCFWVIHHIEQHCWKNGAKGLKGHCHAVQWTWKVKRGKELKPTTIYNHKYSSCNLAINLAII